jgi:hypothetical protein
MVDISVLYMDANMGYPSSFEMDIHTLDAVIKRPNAWWSFMSFVAKGKSTKKNATMNGNEYARLAWQT